MPIIASSKKRMRQNEVSRVRNRSQLSQMRSLIKNIIKWTEGGEVKKAEDVFNDTQKIIDTCTKKNLIHKNNAARKKSRIANLIAFAKKNPVKTSEKKSKTEREDPKKNTPTQEKPVEREEKKEV